MMDELHDYEFYFGVSEPNHNPPIRPWHLRHVTEFNTRVDTTTVEMGIPGRPPSDIQVFQTQGVKREINISGIRVDGEEYVSNLQFLFALFSPEYPHDDMSGTTTNAVSAGLTSMVSVVQSATAKYKLIIKRRNNENLSAVDDSLPTGIYNVSLTGFSIQFMQQKGTMSYRLKLLVGTETSYVPFSENVKKVL